MKSLGIIPCETRAPTVSDSTAPSPPPPPLSVSHLVRISALEPEHLWSLDGDALRIITENQPEVAIALSSICQVRLAYEPTRMQLGRYRCYLYSSGGKIATIQNAHYKGFASFEDRNDSYIRFLETLLPRIDSLNPHCEFVTGVSMLRWLANAAILGTIALIVLVTTLLLYTAIGWLVAVKLLIIAFFIPAAIGWFMKNKPRNFLPRKIPENLLPRSSNRPR